MFLARWKPKTTVFAVFFAPDRKNHDIFFFGPDLGKHWYLRSFQHVARRTVFMPKAQKHCNCHRFRSWQAAKKTARLSQKVPKTHLQACGHRPVHSETWWLSPYEFTMHWEIVGLPFSNLGYCLTLPSGSA